MKIIYSPPEDCPAPRKADLEVGSLVRHKCGGPVMYVFEGMLPHDGLYGCRFWDAVTSSFEMEFLSPDELVEVDDRAC